MYGAENLLLKYISPQKVTQINVTPYLPPLETSGNYTRHKQSTREHFCSKNYVPTLFLFRSQKSTSFFGFPLFSNLQLNCLTK